MSNLSIALAQSAYRVGNIAANTARILEQAEQAQAQGAGLLLVPELALTGYPPEDLLLRPSLRTRVEAAVEQLRQHLPPELLVVVGLPHAQDDRLFNSAAVIYQAQVRGLYHKQALPNYGVFDERRYFDAGQDSLVLDYRGRRLGVLICEDIWKTGPDSPLARLKASGAELVLVLNASPFEQGKQAARIQLLTTQAQAYGVDIAYANLVGGQDDLVFDGGSLLVNRDGTVAAEATRFAEGVLRGDHVAGQGFLAHPRTDALSTPAEVYQALVTGVRDYVNNSGFQGVLLGLSGGIDSALTLAIAVDALGPNRVHAVMMPFDYTAPMSIEDAKAQAERLGVPFAVAPIAPVVSGFNQVLQPFFAGSAADTTEENLQARSRGTVLMALSNKLGYLVLTTGNKSEMAVGYATLYGDMAGGFDVLKDVYKTQVFELANYRNQLAGGPVIPQRVIDRPPSAELRPEQTDQDSLPDYAVLDAILKGYIERDQSLNELVAQGFDPEVVARVVGLVDRNEYKRRQAAIGPRVTGRAFGRERRYPQVNGWRAGL